MRDTFTVLPSPIGSNVAVVGAFIEAQMFLNRQEQREYYRRLEDQLTVLLGAMAGRMEPTRLKESVELVKSGEYGLALEALCEVINEDRSRLPAASYAVIESLGQTMGLDPTTWEAIRALIVPA